MTRQLGLSAYQDTRTPPTHGDPATTMTTAHDNPTTVPGAAPESVDSPPVSEAPARAARASVLTRFGVPLFLVLLIAAFSVALPETFPKGGNLRAVLADQSIPLILALAAVLPLTAGEFDLSIGAVLGFSSITAISLSEAGLPWPAVLACTLIVGLVIGAVNAVLVVGIGVNAFIATLASATVLSGLNLLVTKSSLLTLSSESYQALTITRFAGGLQVVVCFAVVVAAVMWYVMERTPYGRYLRATGLGRDAARLSGVRTKRYLTSAFVAAGVLAAFAGFLQASRSGSAPPTLGPEFLLPAYAAAFLGATCIKPGFFNVLGTVTGVLLLAVGSNGLTLAGAQTWVTNVFNGVALALAVSISVLVTRSKNRARVR